MVKSLLSGWLCSLHACPEGVLVRVWRGVGGWGVELFHSVFSHVNIKKSIIKNDP